MALERREERRLTNEERDRVLDIAARLQAQHHSTVAVGDLAQAANEAGIDEHFVHEALARLDHKEPAPPVPWTPLVPFALQAVFFMVVNYPGDHAFVRPLRPHEVATAFVVSLLIGLWAARSRSYRWFVPAASAGVWTLIGIAYSIYLDQRHALGAWEATTASIFGTVQTFAAALAAGLMEVYERRTRP